MWLMFAMFQISFMLRKSVYYLTFLCCVNESILVSFSIDFVQRFTFVTLIIQIWRRKNYSNMLSMIVIVLWECDECLCPRSCAAPAGCTCCGRRWRRRGRPWAPWGASPPPAASSTAAWWTSSPSTPTSGARCWALGCLVPTLPPLPGWGTS